MRKYLIAASVAAMLGAGGIAIAAAANSAQAPAAAVASDGAPHHGGFFAHLDTNGDGVVTRQEFDASRTAQFTRMDANNDGSLTRDEMRGGRHRGQGDDAQNGQGGEHRWGGRHGGGRMREMMVERADANHDGNISRDEFLAGPIERFNRLDANHDGVISADERQAVQARFEQARENRPHLDANGDGVVTRAEFNAAGVSMFDRMDKNHDGRVTQDELPQRGHREASPN
ncbi:MAG: hypothetical protein ABUS48_02615 [Pseudomonadota bacterium]